MTLEEFLAAERKRLDEFAAMWREGSTFNTAAFPAVLSPAEWAEHLEMFDS